MKQTSAQEQSYLAVPREEAYAKIEGRITKGTALIDSLSSILSGQLQLKDVQQDFYTWNEFNEELLERIFTTTKYKDDYVRSVGFIGIGETSIAQKVTSLHNDISYYNRKLKSILEKLELIPEIPSSTRENTKDSTPSEKGNDATKLDMSKIFIVHGQNEAIKQEVARFLEKGGLVPVILHEQANKGATIIEKFQENSDVSCAIVLMTGDDEARRKNTNTELAPRARQNVVLELGYFIAKLGLKRVIVLYEAGVEIPSDFSGVLYTSIDTAGAWKMPVAKELSEMGIPFDIRKTF